MKQPLQALLVAPSHYMRSSIVSSAKAGSIREGHRDYKPGQVMLCCHLVPWCVMADITAVRHTTLGAVARKDWEASGFGSREEMIDGLKSFYKDLTKESPVTVIHWENPRGFLVDNAADYADSPADLYARIEHE